jgi:hypothetical protein
MRARLGDVTVAIEDGRTLTAFGDGRYLVADHHEQDGQAETAAALGMTVEEMNRSHDLAHSLISFWLGLRFSPTLHDVACDRKANHIHDLEEDAVKALQRFAKAMGVDLVKVAERI